VAGLLGCWVAGWLGEFCKQKLMRNPLLLVFVLAYLSSHGQDKVVFKSFFKPNKVYTTTMSTTSETEVDIAGDEAMMERIKASGTKLPIVVIGLNESVITSTTGSLTSKKTMPVKIVFEKALRTQKQGEKSVEDTSMTGLAVEGHYEDGIKLTVDSVISDKFDNAGRAVLKSTLESIMQQVSFPEAPMKIGDNFEQKMPIQIPIGGQKPISMVIITDYKLIAIKNNIATFDIKQTVTLDMSIEQFKVSASGSGAGVSEFDIANSTISKTDTNLAMTMSMNEGGMEMTAKVKSLSKQSVTVR
jgi:hypothetical protein